MLTYFCNFISFSNEHCNCLRPNNTSLEFIGLNITKSICSVIKHKDSEKIKYMLLIKCLKLTTGPKTIAQIKRLCKDISTRTMQI